FLIVANFNPADTAKLAAFRSKYQVPGSVQVVGPFGGALNNAGDNVRLSKPGVPSGGSVPYILVDAVDYGASTPWPSEPDGPGAPLRRLHPSQFGNDPANWITAAPIAAQISAGIAPVILTQPANQTVYQTFGVSFSVSVAGTAPLGFQWRLNGT